MSNLLLGITGSVATIRALELEKNLQRSNSGHEIKIVSTRAAQYFWPAEFHDRYRTETENQLPWMKRTIYTDREEWPTRERTLTNPSSLADLSSQLADQSVANHSSVDQSGYQRGDEVLHIELRRWADLLLLAPIDANTMAKLSSGICDNLLTCVYRAWEKHKPIILAPAMNTSMWDNRITLRQFIQIVEDREGISLSRTEPLSGLIDLINRTCTLLKIVPPISKSLACGDVGIGALAELDQIVQVVEDVLKR